MPASPRVATGLASHTGPSPVSEFTVRTATNMPWDLGVDLRMALPRDPETFDAPLGPMFPIPPMPINSPREGGVRPDPRRMIPPISYNLPTPPGDIKLVPFEALRFYGNNNPIARACIDFRKGDLSSLDWAIVLRPSSVKDPNKGSDYLLDERRKLREFFKRPDPNFHTLGRWLAAMLEEVLTIDALTIFPRWARDGGKGRWFNSGLVDLVLIDGACYSDDTEVLTDHGWKRFTEVDLAADRFATRNQQTKRFEWQQATYFHHQHHDGELIHFKGRSVDLLVTPNHRMLYTTSSTGAEMIAPAHKIENYAAPRLIATSEWDAPDLEKMIFTPANPRTRAKPFEVDGDTFAAFMGMYMAEGSAIVADRDHPIVISQSENGKGYREFHDLLVRMLGYEPLRNGHDWRFCNTPLWEYLRPFGKSHEKCLPREILDMSRRQLEIFWHYYWLGDGSTEHTRTGESYVAATVSKELADDLQEVIQKLGWSCSVRGTRAQRVTTLRSGQRILPENTRVCYRMRVRKTARPEVGTERVPYTGEVYCASVPNEVLYVRRNGHPMWCGNTIKPYVDSWGYRPTPPNAAYAQFAFGVPRSEFIDLGLSDDPLVQNAVPKEYRADQLIYEMMDYRVGSIYGYSRTEYVIIQVLIGMKRMESQLDWYTEGSIPGMFLYAPADWTNSQMRQFERVLNETLGGNLAFKSKIKVLPQGMKADPIKLPVVNSDVDMLNVQMTCMGYEVRPTDIGFMPLSGLAMNSSQARGALSMESQSNKPGLKRSAKFFEDIFNMIIWDIFKLPEDIEFKFMGLDPVQDQQLLSQVNKTYLSAGVYSIDEVRESLGKEGWGLQETKYPVVMTATGPVPLTAAVQAAGAIAQHQVETVEAAKPGQGGISPLLDREMRNSNGQPTLPSVPRLPKDDSPTGPNPTPLDENKAFGPIDVDFYLERDPDTGDGGGVEKGGRGNAGNIADLERWYRNGGAGYINWGVPDDFYRCLDIAGKYLPDAEAKGFCSNRHHEALGVWPGQEDGGRSGHKGAATIGGTCCANCGPSCDGSCCGHCCLSTPNPEPPAQPPTPVTDALANAAEPLSELTALKKYLERRKWRPNRAFESTALSVEVVTAASASPEAWEFVYKAVEARQEDEQNFARRAVRLAGHVHRLVREHASIIGPDSDVLDRLTASLGDAFKHAYATGAEFWGREVDPMDGRATMLAQAQRPYLARFLTDAAKMSDAAIHARAGLYGAHLWSAYLSGMVHYAPLNTRWLWKALGNDPCDQCAARDGQVYTQETLPGVPGTGGFGELCAGAMRCRCDISPLPPLGS